MQVITISDHFFFHFLYALNVKTLKLLAVHTNNNILSFYSRPQRANRTMIARPVFDNGTNIHRGSASDVVTSFHSLEKVGFLKAATVVHFYFDSLYNARLNVKLLPFFYQYKIQLSISLFVVFIFVFARRHR